ncbi:MAG: GNAT family N-acetyltransferase [Paracoccaceae bacterium]
MSLVIRTERLVLRPPVRDDFDDYAAMWAEDYVTRHITGTPQSRAESHMRFQRVMGGWAFSGFGFFMVFDLEGRFLGQSGLFEALRDLGAGFDGAPEAGWGFCKAASGQGYAREATLAAHRWFDAQRFAQRSVCMISPDNAASLALAQKCGYAAFGRATYAGADVVLMQRACT